MATRRNTAYQVWASMKKRCNNPNAINYYLYGARGVKVCDSWNAMSGFDAFIKDMGERPGQEYSIDRIDPEGDYSPSNCRWATRTEQANNRRDTKYLELDGLRMPLHDWARKLNIKSSTLRQRVYVHKLPVERCLKEYYIGY